MPQRPSGAVWSAEQMFSRRLACPGRRWRRCSSSTCSRHASSSRLASNDVFAMLGPNV